MRHADMSTMAKRAVSLLERVAEEERVNVLLPLRLPADPSSRGLRVYSQGMVVDPAANSAVAPARIASTS